MLRLEIFSSKFIFHFIDFLFFYLFFFVAYFEKMVFLIYCCHLVVQHKCELSSPQVLVQSFNCRHHISSKQLNILPYYHRPSHCHTIAQLVLCNYICVYIKKINCTVFISSKCHQVTFAI